MYAFLRMVFWIVILSIYVDDIVYSYRSKNYRDGLQRLWRMFCWYILFSSAFFVYQDAKKVFLKTTATPSVQTVEKAK